MNYKKKICVVTTSRAEYGLLYWFLKFAKKDKEIKLQLVVTGSHTSLDYGMTKNIIINDKFKIDKQFDLELNNDSVDGIINSTSIAMTKFSNAFTSLKPNIIILLGDRYELLAASYAALVNRIPIAHFHGGETTEGAIDESIRHAISKMSHIHLVSNEKYRKRVIQLGENPKSVHLVGGMGIENIKKLKFLQKNKLEKILKFTFGKKNILITFHPVTHEINTSKKHITNIINAIKEFKDIKFIFTMPNADTDNKIISENIKGYVLQNSNNSVYFINMGQLNYLSSLKYVDAVLGNSSSGILEAPSFKIGTINIGDRQKGRVRSKSTIDCDCDKDSIVKSINKLYSKSFIKKLRDVNNPYDYGKSAYRSLQIIKKTKLHDIVKKPFFDIFHKY